MKEKILELIRELQGKGGESYSNEQHHGWRNPVRDDTGPLLTALAELRNPKRVLEFGTAYGLSTAHIALGLAPASEIDTIEFDVSVAAIAQESLKKSGIPATVWAGDAMTLIPTMRHRAPYDLVFLDHEKKAYNDTLQALVTNGMIGPGTMLLADNVTDRRLECEDFLITLQTSRVHYTILPTECGLLVATLE